MQEEKSYRGTGSSFCRVKEIRYAKRFDRFGAAEKNMEIPKYL